MKLMFVMPAHGRLELSRICMRQLRRTCDAICDAGVRASAVVVACDANLDTADGLGFGWVERDNEFLSRRFNDGIEFALDEGRADYVVPIGSDDWAHPDLFLQLPAPDAIVGFQKMCFVREDGREMVCRHLAYPGGSGVRIYPRQLLTGELRRPADEHRNAGCDTSILTNVRSERTVRIVHRDIDGRQLVDWKTAGQQINSYDKLSGHREIATFDPFDELRGFFPGDALDEMAAHYGLVAA